MFSEMQMRKIADVHAQTCVWGASLLSNARGAEENCLAHALIITIVPIHLPICIIIYIAIINALAKQIFLCPPFGNHK